MEYRRIGNSGLKVSEVGLGGNNFGAWADEPTSIRVIDKAINLGINFLDTAALYSQGKSEEIMGKALKGKRSQVIIATKFGHPVNLGPKECGGSRSYIIKAVELNLKRLETDYIDLYYIHYPDMETPIEETLRALDDLVRTGKVRYLACSNFAAWQLCEAVWCSNLHNLEPFIAIQSRYNLLDRNIERELVPCCQRYGIGVIPWGPLASGFLTGKYRRGERIPAGVRLANPPAIYRDVLTDANFDRLARFEAFARERDHTVGELAIAWLLSHSWIGSVIAGATSEEQLISNTKAAEWKMSTNEIMQLEKMLY